MNPNSYGKVVGILVKSATGHLQVFNTDLSSFLPRPLSPPVAPAPTTPRETIPLKAPVLRHMLAASPLPRQRIAEETGLSVSSIHRFMASRTNPRRSTLIAIRNWLSTVNA
jgi:hypothetical protein